MLVDGAEFSDPASHTFFGGGKDASGIEIPEDGSTYYLPQDVPHGAVREIWYWSRSPQAGDTPSSIYRRATTTQTKAVIQCCICSTAAAKMRPAGSGRAANFILDNLVASGKHEADDHRDGLRLCKTRRPTPDPDLTGRPFGSPEMMKAMQELWPRPLKTI